MEREVPTVETFGNFEFDLTNNGPVVVSLLDKHIEDALAGIVGVTSISVKLFPELADLDRDPCKGESGCGITLSEYKGLLIANLDTPENQPHARCMSSQTKLYTAARLAAIAGIRIDNTVSLGVIVTKKPTASSNPSQDSI